MQLLVLVVAIGATLVACTTTSNSLSLSYIPPKFVAEPKDAYGFPGETMQLACQATGTPPPIYSWRKDELELDVKKTPGMKIDSGYLTIESFESANAGSYQCQARVNIGSRELMLTSSVAVVTSSGNLLTTLTFSVNLKW